ncbi:MAG: FtsX-like permease family protein [Odoribacter sp.]|nr:FtsX-like permease family protein [Odoribacter sp.]
MRAWHELVMNFRRFRTAGILNVFGLSVAFAAFAVIVMQLTFQYGYDRFHKNADRIFRTETLFPVSLQYSAFGPQPVGALLKGQCPLVEDYFLMGSGGEPVFVLKHGDGTSDKFKEQSMKASGSFVDILGVEIVEGDGRQALTEPNMLLIPQSTARKWFGKESAVKKQVYSGDMTVSYTVAAVYKDMPGNSVFKNVCYTRLPEREEEWGDWDVQIYLLAASRDRQVLQQQVNGAKIEAMEQIFEGLHKKEQMEKEGKFYLRVSPLTGIYYDHTTVFDTFEKGTKRGAAVMLAIGILIILIAEINFVNFSISLAPTRMKAVNTQKVLGASAGRLRMRLVGEAVAYSLIAFGLALGWLHLFGLSGFASLFPMPLAPAGHAGLLAAVGGGAVLMGIFAGLYPAWYVTSFEPALVLKGSFIMSPKGIRLRNGLMAFQFITSIVLIICTLLIGMQYRYMQHYSLGYDTENIGFFELDRNLAGSQSALISEMTAIPGVTDYTFANHILGTDQIYGMGLDVEGEALQLNRWNVYKNFLDFIGVSIVKGENFSESDQSAQLILNETAIRKHPILEHSFGTTIATSPKLGRFVGVIKDIHYMSLRVPLAPLAITCEGDDGYNYMFLKLAGGDLPATVEKIRQVYERLNPDGMFEFEFLDRSLQRNYEGERKLMQVVFLMGGIAIVLALVGVYGLVVFNAQYKRKEIGIRKVNGATERQIMVLLNRNFFRMLIVSFAVACPIAWYVIHRWLEGFSYKTPVHWWIFLLGGLFTLVIALLTVSWQSWKAASVNPVEVLKNE